MAAVSPAGPDPTITTWRDSVMPRPRPAGGSVRRLQATTPDDDEEGPHHQVRQPDPAVEGIDGEQADEGDRQQGDGDHAGGEDDDAEHDGPGGQRERSDGLVPEQGDQGLDEVGGPGRQIASGRSRGAGVLVFRAADPWCEDSRDPRTWPAGTRVGERSVDGTMTVPIGARSGVGPDHRAEVDHHERELGLDVLRAWRGSRRCRWPRRCTRPAG